MTSTRSVMADACRHHPWKVLALLLLVALVVLASLAPPQILRIIIDRHLAPGHREGLAILAVCYVAVVLLSAIMEAVKSALLAEGGQRMVTELRRKMGSKLFRLPLSSFTHHSPGEVASHFSNDAEQVNALFSNGLANLVIDLSKVIGIVVSIALFSPRLALLVLCFIPVIIVITRGFRRAMFRSQQANLQELSHVSSTLAETLAALPMIKSYAREPYMEAQYRKELSENFTTMDRVNSYDSVFSAIITILKSVVIALTVLLSAQSGWSLGITAGMLAASIDLVSDLFKPIDALGMEMEQIQKGRSGIAAIDRFLSLAEEPPKNEKLTLEDVLPSHSATLCFQHVSFRYPDGSEDVLTNMDLAIPAGEHVTFLGRTGVGKSTLFRLVLGLMHPTQGEILLNGIDVFSIPTKWRRRIYGYVSQEFTPVEGSLTDQVSLGDPAISPEACARALAFVGLCDDGSSVDILSQGQKQLLSIARAIVCEPPILLLDEPTSAIDTQTERHLWEIMEKAGTGRTVLTITHRSSCLEKTDHIIRLGK